MTQGSNISFTIKSGENLSYIIDKKLDADLGVDVKLGIDEWNSVFTLVKDNQVSTNKDQFGSKDTDIRNGKHYVVHEGTYEIASNVWTQIVDIAKRKMGITTTEVPEQKAIAQEEINTNSTINNDEIQATITTYLKNAGIDFESNGEEFKVDLVGKYRTMKSVKPDISEDELQTRIVNYAKGWMYNHFEKKAIYGKKPEDLQTNCSAKTEEELKENYTRFASEYIEYYDVNMDGEISVSELLRESIEDYYRYEIEGDTMNRQEAIKKATEVVIAYENGTLQPNETGSADEKLLDMVINKIEYLNRGASLEEDKTLDIKDIKAYLLTLAQIEDKNNNVTSQERLTMETAITSFSIPITDKMQEAYDFIN